MRRYAVGLNGIDKVLRFGLQYNTKRNIDIPRLIDYNDISCGPTRYSVIYV